MPGAYGQELGRRFKLEKAPTLVNQTIRKTSIAVTHFRNDAPNLGLTEPIAREDAYQAVVLLQRGVHRYDYWEDGKALQTNPHARGDVSFFDLRSSPTYNVITPFDTLWFYLPHAALDAIAEDADAPCVSGLRYRPGVSTPDPTLFELSQLLLPAFLNPAQASRIFIDYVTLAAAAHILHTYGGMRPASHERSRGGLAPWQERRAKELLNAHLDGDVTVADLAQECRLSARHFARAFRQTLGVTPHQWLMKRRIEQAQALLSDRSLTLLDIAQACGFADQSHFTRAYARLTGSPPGTWRRRLEPAAAATGSGLQRSLE
jgi:AraC-like DNA-binding protein